MRFGTGTTVHDIGFYREWLSVADAAQFDLLTVGDSQSLWADPFVCLTVAAQATRGARLAVTVSNPKTRHPAVVASSLSALQQISGDRVCYGFSSGDSALRNIGVPPATVAEMEEFGRAVKGLCAGESVTYDGIEMEMRWEARPTPIWLAAEGPRTQQLAGRIADGVVLSNALDAEVLRLARENIAIGAESVGRDPGEVEIWCMAAMCPAETEAAGIEKLRFLLAGTANHVYRFHTEGKALPEEYADRVRQLQARYDSTAHASPERAAANGRLVEELGLVEFLAARSVIAGPVERRIERLHEVAEAGATNLILSQFVDDQLTFMREFADRIKPEFS